MSGIYLQKRLIPGRAKRAILAIAGSRRARVFQRETRSFTLTVRDFQPAEQPGGPNTEKDGQHISRSLKTSTAETALVLIDVWADHPIKGWQARADENVREKLRPLVDRARESGVLIVHSPHGEAIHPLIKPTANDLIIDDPDEQVHLDEILKKQGVRHLLYGGYASNMCILGRPTGIFEMAKRGYEVVFVRDASLAIEAPEFLEEQLTHKVVTYIIEANWGVSTDVDAVLTALNGE